MSSSGYGQYLAFISVTAGRVRTSFQDCLASYLREDVDVHISSAADVSPTPHVERVRLERRSLRHIVNQGTRSSYPATVVKASLLQEEAARNVNKPRGTPLPFSKAEAEEEGWEEKEEEGEEEQGEERGWGRIRRPWRR